MANGRWAAELIDRAWVDLDEDERQVFDDWLKNAKGHDLYILLRHVRRGGRRQSSVQLFKAVTGGDPEDGS
jgi:hypothetical protein